MVLFIFYSPFQFNAPQHAYLIYSLPQHLAHKLEELQVILMNIRCGRRVESLIPTGCLEQIECRVKYPLDDLFQELLENTVLINPGLVHSEVIDELHTDHTLHGMLGELPKLLVAILQHPGPSDGNVSDVRGGRAGFHKPQFLLLLGNHVSEQENSLK